MNTNEILAARAARLAVKGPKPRLNDYTSKFLAKHSQRVAVADIDATVAALNALRQTNAQVEADEAAADAAIAQQKAAELAAAIVAAPVVETPVAATVAAPVAA